MEKEFRRYDKINCSLFDLISGDLEPKQTMALGYLLANSEAALRVLLDYINININCDKYIVNCEAQTKQQNNNGRIDILILFYNEYKPVHAIIIEAKSVRVNSNHQNAINQAGNYVSSHELQKKGFKNITIVALTRNVELYVQENPMSEKTMSLSMSLSWSKLISMLHNKAKSKNKDVHERERELINNFINFIINIKGSMEYYEEEILSIAAGKTFDAIKASGIYECPISYPIQKKSLYVTFRKKKGGKMTTLYKLIDIFEIDLENDEGAINIINSSTPGFKEKIEVYKAKAKGKISKPEEKKRKVYLLDKDNKITLPYPVRPVENNSSVVYYKLCDFLGKPNSNKKDKTVYVQKKITINEKNQLKIEERGETDYELYENENKNPVSNFSTPYKLNTKKKYKLKLPKKHNNVHLQSVILKHNRTEKKWKFTYNF